MNKIYFISCAINRQDRMSVVTTFRKHCTNSDYTLNELQKPCLINDNGY